MSRRVVTWDLLTWGEIASALGCSEKTARRYAQWDEDPLPVGWFNGRVRARSEDIRAWLQRHTTWSSEGADAA